MNVITVSREYGAGGYEVAHRLAEALGWELLDRELLHQAAMLEHLPDAELERLDEKAISLADRFRLNPPHARYVHGLREAALQAAGRGNVVLVGRGTAQLLPDTLHVLHLRLVAPRDWRARRMAQREGWSYEQALARCTQEDSTRDCFMRYFFGQAPCQSEQYALVLNTGRMPLADVVAVVVGLIRPLAAGGPANPSVKHRVLTLARELGAGAAGLARALADRLGLRVFDRELLEQQAHRLGVTEQELARIDEQPAGWWQRFFPGSLHQRYQDALRKLMDELDQQGNVLIVGRGGSRFLRERPDTFHVRLVAKMDVRVERVMAHRWVREDVARTLIAESDTQRRRFFQDSFAADWSDPLEYHLTVNTGRLGLKAVDLVADACRRYWERTDT